MRSFEILLVVDDEIMAQTLSAALRRAGHRVTASTTVAGTVETLMRRGPSIDVILTSTRFDGSLADDVVQYSRKFASRAKLIALREPADRVDDLELVLDRQFIPDRLGTGGSN